MRTAKLNTDGVDVEFGQCLSSHSWSSMVGVAVVVVRKDWGEPLSPAKNI